MTRIKRVLYILVFIGLSCTMVTGQFSGGEQDKSTNELQPWGCSVPGGTCI